MPVFTEPQAVRALIAATISDKAGLTIGPPADAAPWTRFVVMADGQTLGRPVGAEVFYLEARSGTTDQDLPFLRERVGTSLYRTMEGAAYNFYERVAGGALPLAARVASLDGRPACAAVIGDALRTAEFGHAPWSEGERRAFAVLYDTQPEQLIRVPSAVFETYLRREDEVRAIRREAGDASSGEALERLREAEADWATRGNKRGVERAQAIVAAAERTKSFEADRLGWQARLKAAEIATVHQPGPFHDAAFRPHAALFDAGSAGWTQETLLRQDVRAFVRGEARGALLAPRKSGLLAKLFKKDPVAAAVRELMSLSFEWRLIEIDAPWLPRELFESDTWRWTDRLSDGKGDGLVPAVPEAMIAIRRVEASFEGTVGVPGGGVGRSLPTRGGGEAEFAVKDLEALRKIAPRALAARAKPKIAVTARPRLKGDATTMLRRRRRVKPGAGPAGLILKQAHEPAFDTENPPRLHAEAIVETLSEPDSLEDVHVVAWPEIGGREVAVILRPFPVPKTDGRVRTFGFVMPLDDILAALPTSVSRQADLRLTGMRIELRTDEDASLGSATAVHAKRTTFRTVRFTIDRPPRTVLLSEGPCTLIGCVAAKTPAAPLPRQDLSWDSQFLETDPPARI